MIHPLAKRLRKMGRRMLPQRILARLHPQPKHEVGLRDESIEGYRDFWERSALTDTDAAVAYGVSDFWKSGASELEMLLPFLSGEAKVLEIGCGTGRIMYHVAPHCRELHGLDISQEMIRRARTNLSQFPNVCLHVGSGYGLPFPAESFDLVYSCRVFQHIPKNIVLNYLKEARRVLKRGKKFLLQVPNILLDEHLLALDHFASPEYFRSPYPMHFYTPAEVERLGSFVGFSVEISDDWLLAVMTKP